MKQKMIYTGNPKLLGKSLSCCCEKYFPIYFPILIKPRNGLFTLQKLLLQH